MKRLARLAVALIAFSLLASPRDNPSTLAESGRERTLASVMRPDWETMRQWEEDYERAPAAYINPEIGRALAEAEARATPKSMSLLDDVTYNPSDRDQGTCGNCWVWAGTSLLEIAHSVEYGVRDRLSTQYVNSCKTDAYACCGGDLTAVSNWYVSRQRVIPWSNSGGSFVDAGEECETAPSGRGCASISTTYSYPIRSIQVQKVTTRDVGQAQAIANIKNVLNQRKAVAFSWCLNNDADWDAFYDFWSQQNESALWSIDPYCGHVWNEGGCHVVLIVGYNEDDSNPSKHYWIVLNSWGTASGKRPNGLFRMKMRMNYDCKASSGSFSTTFETANATFSSSNRLYMAAKSATSNDITVSYMTAGGSTSPWKNAIIYKNASDVAPSLAVFSSRLYMAAKNATDNNIRIRYMYGSGYWVSSTTLTGQPTNAAPALVVFNNRLYVFIKGSSGNTIYYRYLATSGAWSSWYSVPAATSDVKVAPVAFRDRLYVFYKPTTSNSVYYLFMNRDGTWDNHVYVRSGASTPGAPAGAYRPWDNSLYLVIRGTSDKIQYSKMDSAGAWSSWTTFTAQTTTAAPSVAWAPSNVDANKPMDRLYIAMMGTGNSINYVYREGSAAWSPWYSSPGKTSGTPAMATYYFSP